jgi:hypothetical protein
MAWWKWLELIGICFLLLTIIAFPVVWRIGEVVVGLFKREGIGDGD